MTVALLIAYAYVLLFASASPYAHRRTNQIGYVAQVDLFLLLLVALLLKARGIRRGGEGGDEENDL